MSYEIKNQKKIDLNKVKLDIEISNNYLKKYIGKAYKNISQKANIPGFRKGKIPYQIIDANFGKQYVLNEAASLSISELYPDIIMESNLKPIDYPKIKITQLAEDLPLGFEAELELEPEIELPGYKGIKVTGLSTDVSDQELERQIDNIRNNFASLEPVEDDKPISKGDYVTLDFDGEIEGKAFEGGSAEDYLLEVGSNTLFAEFEDSLIGMKKGVKKNVILTLPENVENKDLSGKQASFSIFIKEIKKKVLPEINDEFLKNLGDYKDADDFKDNIKKRLIEQKESVRRGKIIEEIFNHIIDNIKSNVPNGMVTDRIKQINEEIDEGLKKQKINRDNYLKAINITEDKLNEEIKERAVREVKEYLIFKALEKAEKKNIEPSEDEIKKEKDNIISRYKKEEDIKKIREFFENHEGNKTLTQTIKRRKIIDLLINSAQVIEEKNTDSRGKEDIWTPDKDKARAEKKAKRLWTPG
ncbi:Trigger factor [subsurface metagenome]|nr:trigger factor [Clostridia bacterium]